MRYLEKKLNIPLFRQSVDSIILAIQHSPRRVLNRGLGTFPAGVARTKLQTAKMRDSK